MVIPNVTVAPAAQLLRRSKTLIPWLIVALLAGGMIYEWQARQSAVAHLLTARATLDSVRAQRARVDTVRVGQLEQLGRQRGAATARAESAGASLTVILDTMATSEDSATHARALRADSAHRVEQTQFAAALATCNAADSIWRSRIAARDSTIDSLAVQRDEAIRLARPTNISLGVSLGPTITSGGIRPLGATVGVTVRISLDRIWRLFLPGRRP